MALTLFTRRPEPVDLAAVEPEPWPEIGETWKPEGVTIAQRYYNQAHAVVLVFTTDDGKYGTYYSIACLGCHYATSENGERTYNTRYGLADAAKVANEHATTCRALPRDIPARPDETPSASGCTPGCAAPATRTRTSSCGCPTWI
ncbi:hypothetical protein ACGFYQ_37990 [Streptomyces sp. NPDC048258]|uniref:hypothetical protein n=1 Tax=Streptomyces sp. NPDC048258 TaxID=3365527 RepID=UPI003711F829